MKRGPKSEAGKVAVRGNAWKHGITSDEIIIHEFEDPAEYDALVEGIFESTKPVGFLECSLAQSIALGFWKMRRTERYQAWVTRRFVAGAEDHLRTSAAYAQGTLSKGILPEVSAEEVHAARGRRLLPKDNEMNTIMRYESHNHRTVLKFLHELEATQERRKGQATPLARLDILGLPAAETPVEFSDGQDTGSALPEISVIGEGEITKQIP